MGNKECVYIATRSYHNLGHVCILAISYTPPRGSLNVILYRVAMLQDLNSSTSSIFEKGSYSTCYQKRNIHTKLDTKSWIDNGALPASSASTMVTQFVGEWPTNAWFDLTPIPQNETHTWQCLGDQEPWTRGKIKYYSSNKYTNYINKTQKGRNKMTPDDSLLYS